jgi:hypothetical protein
MKISAIFILPLILVILAAGFFACNVSRHVDSGSTSDAGLQEDSGSVGNADSSQETVSTKSIANDESSAIIDSEIPESTILLETVSDNLKSDHLDVYYFHRTTRCDGCIQAEQAIFEVIDSEFMDAVNDGRLSWHTVDFELPENTHFVEKYNLYYQALIFVQVKNGEEVEWRDIAEIWEHTGIMDEMKNVVRTNIDEWLEKLSE